MLPTAARCTALIRYARKNLANRERETKRARVWLGNYSGATRLFFFLHHGAASTSFSFFAQIREAEPYMSSASPIRSMIYRCLISTFLRTRRRANFGGESKIARSCREPDAPLAEISKESRKEDRLADMKKTLLRCVSVRLGSKAHELKRIKRKFR